MTNEARVVDAAVWRVGAKVVRYRSEGCVLDFLGVMNEIRVSLPTYYERST